MGAGVVVRNRLLRGFGDRIYRYVGAAIGFLAEGDGAGFERKKRVILAHADIDAGMPGRAALTNDDVARNDGFAAELLHAEALGFANRDRCATNRQLSCVPSGCSFAP